MHTNEGG